MSNILQAIADTASTEIEAAGFALRVRRIRSADLAEVGVAALQTVPAAFKGDEKKTTKQIENSTLSPAQMKKITGYQEAVICAALIAIGDPVTGEWDNVQVMMDPKREDPTKGKLWVGSLPQSVIAAVFAESMRLTTDNEVAAERLAAFRSGTGIASAG